MQNTSEMTIERKMNSKILAEHQSGGFQPDGVH